jgi:hypothetical protein
VLSVSFHFGISGRGFMATASNQALGAAKPPVPLTAQAEHANGKREYQAWVRCCALELKKADGLSSVQRFFCAAFSLLFAGKQRTDLDREIDVTIDTEISQKTPPLSLQFSAGKMKAKKYVTGYFAADEKRNREKRFHDAVLFLFYEGFTREQLHRFAAQAEET